jgi:hypothetical protein
LKVAGDGSERDVLHEHLVHSFYQPWLEHLGRHEDNHKEILGDDNQEPINEVVPIPVLSGWTIIYFGWCS